MVMILTVAMINMEMEMALEDGMPKTMGENGMRQLCHTWTFKVQLHAAASKFSTVTTVEYADIRNMSTIFQSDARFSSRWRVAATTTVRGGAQWILNCDNCRTRGHSKYVHREKGVQ